MSLKIFRFKLLKDHTAPARYKDPFTTIKNNTRLPNFGSDKICPVYLLPLLIAVILLFTIAQIVMIHRTIEAYKLRDKAYKDCYYPNENGVKKNGTALVKNVTALVLPSNNMSSEAVNSAWAVTTTGNISNAKIGNFILNLIRPTPELPP